MNILFSYQKLGLYWLLILVFNKPNNISGRFFTLIFTHWKHSTLENELRPWSTCQFFWFGHPKVEGLLSLELVTDRSRSFEKKVALNFWRISLSKLWQKIMLLQNAGEYNLIIIMIYKKKKNLVYSLQEKKISPNSCLFMPFLLRILLTKDHLAKGARCNTLKFITCSFLILKRNKINITYIKLN